MGDLVVGIDAGGTTTRCLVLATDGRPAGHGRAGGASIRSSGGSARERLTEALLAAVRGVDPDRIRRGVFGVAGAGRAGADTVQAAADAAWRAAGLAGRPRIVPDLDVAFAAGSPRPDGLLLLAGTGAAAAAFRDRRIDRRCDGYGWLLGDQGSAVWLGLRGVRAALDAADGRGAPTRLVSDLAARFDAGPQDEFAQVLIARIHADAPARLGDLAPIVTRAAEEGDVVAAGLVDAAADRLVAAVDAVAVAVPGSASASVPSQGEGTPVDLVLAGGLLAAGPVRAAVQERLAARPGLLVRDAGPGEAGAALLALADLDPRALTAEVHATALRTVAG